MNLTVIDHEVNPSNCYAIEIVTEFYFGGYSKFEIEIKADHMLPSVREDNEVEQKDLVDAIICLEVLKKVMSKNYKDVENFNIFEDKWILDERIKPTIIDDYNLYYYNHKSQKMLVHINLNKEERSRIKNEILRIEGE